MSDICYICKKEVNPERVEYLKSAFGQTNNFTCIECANHVVKPYKGLLFGSSGAPELVIVRDVGETSGIYKPEENEISEETEIELDNSESVV